MWVYLFSGLIGIGVVGFAYMYVKEKIGYVETFLDTDIRSFLTKYIGIGYYLTGLFSILLFLTGFDKSDNISQSSNEMDSSKVSNMGQVRDESELATKESSSVQKWLNENPGKSLNDYFAKHR